MNAWILILIAPILTFTCFSVILVIYLPPISIITISAVITIVGSAFSALPIPSIDPAVAIVVNAVLANLLSTRIDSRIRVVAVHRTTRAAFHRIAVPVCIRTTHFTPDRIRVNGIHQTVAIIVHAVRATLYGTGMNGRIRIITVYRTTGVAFHRIAVSILIRTSERTSDGIRVGPIQQTVTVVVDPVRAIL